MIRPLYWHMVRSTLTDYELTQAARVVSCPALYFALAGWYATQGVVTWCSAAKSVVNSGQCTVPCHHHRLLSELSFFSHLNKIVCISMLKCVIAFLKPDVASKIRLT